MKTTFNPIGGDLWSLTIEKTVPVWVYPRDRFIEYGPEDEWWARKLGFGHEELREQTIHIPRGFIKKIDGLIISFTALPEPSLVDFAGTPPQG